MAPYFPRTKQQIHHQELEVGTKDTKEDEKRDLSGAKFFILASLGVLIFLLGVASEAGLLGIRVRIRETKRYLVVNLFWYLRHRLGNDIKGMPQILHHGDGSIGH